ncbi:MAG: TIGR00730 family Rossman fold protein, partial [Stellaceae bacterium]
MSQKRLCVFCGSAMPESERYRGAASALGRLIGEAGVELVYGGGRIGLMGLLADAALAAGARVVGVIPIALHDREVAHRALSELIVVPDMQERKRRMLELADAVAVLPG